MGDIGKFFNNGKKIALPVKVIFTGKPVNQFYRFLPDFTGKNAQVYTLCKLILKHLSTFNATSLKPTYRTLQCPV